MGLDVGKVTIEYLPCPEGLAKQFAWRLASEASCWSDGNAFGFYFKQELEQQAKEFLAEEKLNGNPLAEDILKDWIDSLPWDEKGYLVLTFNW
jgi:hypothetical protein